MSSCESVAMNESTAAEAPYIDMTRLVAACQYGDLDFVRQSVELHGISPDSMDSEGCSLLHWAAINNRVQIVRFLLSMGANPDIIGGTLQETPLQWTSRSDDYIFMIRLLIIEGNASFITKNTLGQDSLTLACQFGCLKITFLLLSLGADPNVKDSRGESPLVWLSKYVLHTRTVCASQCDPIEIHRLLLNFGADPFAVDDKGDGIFHIICKAGSKRANFQAAYDVFNATNLQSSSLNIVSLRNSSCETPWLISYSNNDLMMLQFLLDCYFYRRLPYIFPTSLVTIFICTCYAVLQYYYWLYGLILIAFMFLLVERLAQPSLPTSRQGNGVAWGIIISLLGNYLIFIHSFVSLACKVSAIAFFVIIMWSLYMTCIVSAGHIPSNKPTAGPGYQRDANLINGVILKGCVDGKSITMEEQNKSEISRRISLTNDSNSHSDLSLRVRKLNRSGSEENEKAMSPPISLNTHNEKSINRSNDRCENLWNNQILTRSHHQLATSYSFEEGLANPDWRFVKPVRLCTSCLVDRSDATTHCGTCDMCVSTLDHHCAFVNNCVGIQNRWYFVLFTGSATFGCLYYFILALFVEFGHYALPVEDLDPEIYPSGFASLKAFMSIAHSQPALFSSKFVALLCVFWIGALFTQQVFFIANKTTSYMVMKGHHKVNLCPISTKCLGVNFLSFFEFLRTGKSEVRSADRLSDDLVSALDNSHSHCNNHTHYHNHIHNDNNINNCNNNNQNGNRGDLGVAEYDNYKSNV